MTDLLKHNLCLFSLQYLDRFDVSEIIKIIPSEENFFHPEEDFKSRNEENQYEENANLEINFISEESLDSLVEKYYNMYESNYEEFFERWNSDKWSLFEYRKFKKYLKKSVEPFKYTNHVDLYQSIMEREFTISGSNDSPGCKYESLQIEDVIKKFLDSKPEISEDEKFLNKKVDRPLYEENF
jgi:hypothetical protein